MLQVDLKTLGPPCPDHVISPHFLYEEVNASFDCFLVSFNEEGEPHVFWC